MVESRQIERGGLVRKIYNIVEMATVKKFKHMLSTNMISNCPISVADIINAKIIYGPSMEILKVNPTRRNIRPVIKDDIQIPI